MFTGLRGFKDTPGFFSKKFRSTRNKNSGKFHSGYQGNNRQGCISQLLSMMIIATLCAFVHDDYTIAQKQQIVRAQSRRSAAALAYERRCLVDNMTTVRKFSVYLNGVVSGGVAGGESNAIYDKECESLLVLLKKDSGDIELYSPSIYLKQISARAVWNILGTVATALACYNSSHPFLLTLSFLLASLFFILGMMNDFVIDFPVLRWLWGVIPDV